VYLPARRHRLLQSQISREWRQSLTAAQRSNHNTLCCVHGASENTESISHASGIFSASVRKFS
jgi:hypothetical protein